MASMSFQAAAFLTSPGSASLRRTCSGNSASTSLFMSRTSPILRLRVVAMANPPTDINEVLSQRIKEAEDVCVADSASKECAVAWDEVEELSAEIAHKRVKEGAKKDPLEEFCKDAPEADECRVYED